MDRVPRAKVEIVLDILLTYEVPVRRGGTLATADSVFFLDINTLIRLFICATFDFFSP